MRLAVFIGQHTEAILAAWETFARHILPAAKMDSLALRDHAADILLATVRDMESVETDAQRLDKSTGYLDGSAENLRLNGASEEHAIGRLSSGFDLQQLVSEYRALRISVLRLWRASRPEFHDQDVDDLNLFHESIDHSLATAVSCYTKRVEESRNMFLAILSHDLRNPLNAISMTAEMFPATGKLDPESDGVRLGHLDQRQGDDVHDQRPARLHPHPPGRGHAGVDRADGLATLCREVVDEFQSANPEAKLGLVSTGDVTGQWDSARLRQVVSNLLGNAIQHGDQSRPMELTLTGEASGVTLAVHNHGRPIPPGELTKVFDPLVRGATAGKPKQNRPGSIGLGLYIARELVLAHGGAIDVQSSGEAGTAFTVHLPRHPPTGLTASRPGASLAADADRAPPPKPYREAVKPVSKQ
jgi:signal transduction histidine kinase